MSNDPWLGEKMSRSDAQRRYSNLVTYQLRPMLADRKLSEEGQVSALKRIVQSAHRFRYESGVVAGMGTREEVVDLTKHMLRPDHPCTAEVKDWIKRTCRAFGASVDQPE